MEPTNIIVEYADPPAPAPERGIVMTGEHPRLIRELQKTETRRLIVPQPERSGEIGFSQSFQEAAWYWKNSRLLKAGYGEPYVHTGRSHVEKAMLAVCPWGKPGDRLWVKETWSPCSPQDLVDKDIRGIIYKADRVIDTPALGWRSPRFMFKWAAQTYLGIMDIRVERIQDLTWRGALAEGIAWPSGLPVPKQPDPDMQTYLVKAFALLWDKLHAKSGHGWENNDWVYVIAFYLASMCVTGDWFDKSPSEDIMAWTRRAPEPVR